MDISKYFGESLGIRDNESRLYIYDQLDLMRVYLLVLCFTKNRRMSYAEVKVQDCYNNCFNRKLRRFLEISFLAIKDHALDNKHRGKGCSCCAFHDILVR